MKILFTYLGGYKKLVLLVLVLATINQVFSMMDPRIIGYMLDHFAAGSKNLSRDEFFNGLLMALLALIGVAMVSRIAKNFQDYFMNVVVQRVGAQIYSDGIRNSLEL